MSTAQASQRPRRIPHAAFGIGAVVLLLLAALVLIALSGQLVRSRGAVILVTAGIPLMIVLTVIVARRWRRARRGRVVAEST
jgi:hypothetical protein